ncbi:MAG: S-adenosylmethionine:tRNA ribosyltransferase-isomerase [Tannerellaceae bacterium]|jgi:S-adenosylmethionine:tRNA ribosyltransferase-isomerase|nr:S-adenosylmethionine:tRNA ribosyltransferase-isomerase [Tannerellaceae bacterium]
MTTKTQQIRIDEYDYRLPDERIAKYPLQQRDKSKLLLYRSGVIAEDSFGNIAQHLPVNSLLAFNNTRVIQARILFPKDSGARIEVFCLEPAEPCDYAAFAQRERCTWHCLVGNLRKWKDGALRRTIGIDGKEILLTAERLQSSAGVHSIEFSWNNPAFAFADVLEHAGVLPIPPYLHRETEACDMDTYQTVYSRVNGSVAAPTAGLHFTPDVLESLDAAGFGRVELTLHVGAGTFRPVQGNTIGEHRMHSEYFYVERRSVERLLDNLGNIIAVGTTSVRTLESLYYAGVTLSRNPDATPAELATPQWMPYDFDRAVAVDRALRNVLDYMDDRRLDGFEASTRIMIAPGYAFKVTDGIITNFHQPRSTLLLLISAFTGEWKGIYDYALEHDFRFLSYGDASLLLR